MNAADTLAHTDPSKRGSVPSGLLNSLVTGRRLGEDKQTCTSDSITEDTLPES